MSRFHLFEKKIVIACGIPKSKFIDFVSGAISNVPFLVIFWFLVAFFAVWQSFFSGVFLAAGLVCVFFLHFVISEGVFKWGAKKLSKERMRPYLAYPKQIKGIGRRFQDSSFPSSHIAAMTGGLFILTYFFAWFFPWSVCIILIMCWSRLRNGMHYPTDVIAGVILGIIYGNIALEILKSIL